jgi:hypothetical protein
MQELTDRPHVTGLINHMIIVANYYFSNAMPVG